MKLTVALILFLLPLCSSGQEWNIDSLKTSKVRLTMDSITALTSNQWYTDSLKIHSWSTLLGNKVLAKFKADSLSTVENLDIANKMNLHRESIQIKLDSLRQTKDSLLNEVRSKRDKLLERTKDKLDEWQAIVNQKLNVNRIPKVEGSNLLNYSLSHVDSIVPGIGKTNLNLAKVDFTNLHIPQAPALDVSEFERLGLSSDLTLLNNTFSLEQMDGWKDIQDQISRAGEGLTKVSSLVQNPGEAMEQSVLQTKEVMGLTGQVQQAEAFKENELMQKADMLKDPEGMKADLKKELVHRAVDHFAGKEQVLQQAMDKMAKYKEKYESLSSLDDVKRLPKNTMQGKPFVLRFIPGIAFQFQRTDDLSLDINPYAAYRITGRLIAGAGWNQRIGYSGERHQFTSASIIYGPRLFTELRVWKSFSSRFEVEWMNTINPNVMNRRASDSNVREWVFTPLMGIKKEQRLFKSVQAIVLLMFNLYDPLHKSPYGDLIYSRIGFEFSLNSSPGKGRAR